MVVLKDIKCLEHYKVHKGFANHVPSLREHFVKTLGIDTTMKKERNIKKVRQGKFDLKDKPKRASLNKHRHLIKKRKKRKLKRKHYENTESV